MVKDYFRLAYRSARQRKLRSWLTMIGIFVGIAAVVALVSLSQGMQNAIAEQFVSLGSDKLVVQSAETGFGPPGTDVSNTLVSKDKDVIEKVNGVDVINESYYVYIGTNLTINIVLQSLFWIILISFIVLSFFIYQKTNILT